MKQAIILAAGEGRRLKPFTMDKPKAMLSIAGKPILQYVIEALAGLGLRRIVIVVGYQKESVFDHIGDGKHLGVDVEYVVQHKQLGTGHALYAARNEAESEFLVLAGNKLIMPETIAQFIHALPPAVLIKKVENPHHRCDPYSGRKLVSIIEKPAAAESNFYNAGIYSFIEKYFTISNLTGPAGCHQCHGSQDETVTCL
jgi:glucose-1-phosphate thymidylyltransferase